MRSASIFVATALGAAPPQERSAPCGFCGATAPGRPTAAVLKENFTNIDELVAPWVCWGCEATLNDARTRGHFAADERGFLELKRGHIWPLLASPPPPPFVFYVTHSGKKHGLFRVRMRVAESRSRFWLQCEQLGGEFVAEEMLPIMRAAIVARKAGALIDSLVTGSYDPYMIAKARSEIRAFEALALPIRSTPIFRIVLPLLPGREDLALTEEALWPKS